MSYKILVIEDSKDFCTLMELALNKSGYEVVCVESGKQGIQKSIEYNPDFIFLDIELNDISGWQVAEQITQMSKNPPSIFMLTAHNIHRNHPKVKEVGAEYCIQKPWAFNQLYFALHNAINYSERHLSK